MSITHSLSLKSLKIKDIKYIKIEVTHDPFSINILSGMDKQYKFNGFNVLDCFEKFNVFLQENNWIPLCNGARLDATVSGMLASTCDGNIVYLLNERDQNNQIKMAYIFDPASDKETGTIAQQTEFIKEYDSNDEKTHAEKFSAILLDKYYGCMLGLACGDAIGTAVEFRKPGTFFHLTDMIGGGPYNLEPGQWTDDTSMALCLASSLIECNDTAIDGFHPEDQMDKYILWRDTGYMSSTDKCFDIGNTVARALNKYRVDGKPYSGSTDQYSAGNGSIMRLASIPLYYFKSIEKTVKYAELSSKITHGAEEAVDACHLLSLLIHSALKGKTKNEILFDTQPLKKLTPKIEQIRKGSYSSKNINDIHGTGYVVESLEAALWCFYTTSNFENAILRAANLGNDADTTAAICGQIAGAYYGAESFPWHWKDKLAKRSMIVKITEKLFNHSSTG